MTCLKEIPGLDNAKLEKAVAIRKAYDENQISLEEAQRQLKSEIQSLKPWEIAQIEQNISPEEGDEACRLNRISDIFKIYGPIMDRSLVLSCPRIIRLPATSGKTTRNAALLKRSRIWRSIP